MKKTYKPLLLLVLIIAVLLAAAIAYPRLSRRYSEAGAEKESVIGDTEDAEAEELASTAPAADFSCLDADGEEVKLSDYFGKPVVINFWATWCPPCRAELGDFDTAYEKYGEKVQFMMVDLTDGDSETAEGVKAFVEENGYHFPIFYDTEQSAVMAYGINAIPQTFFINAEGEVTAMCYGRTTGEELEKQLDKLTGTE